MQCHVVAGDSIIYIIICNPFLPWQVLDLQDNFPAAGLGSSEMGPPPLEVSEDPLQLSGCMGLLGWPRLLRHLALQSLFETSKERP